MSKKTSAQEQSNSKSRREWAKAVAVSVIAGAGATGCDRAKALKFPLPSVGPEIETLTLTVEEPMPDQFHITHEPPGGLKITNYGRGVVVELVLAGVLPKLLLRQEADTEDKIWPMNEVFNTQLGTDFELVQGSRYLTVKPRLGIKKKRKKDPQHFDDDERYARAIYFEYINPATELPIDHGLESHTDIHIEC